MICWWMFKNIGFYVFCIQIKIMLSFVEKIVFWYDENCGNLIQICIKVCIYFYVTYKIIKFPATDKPF